MKDLPAPIPLRKPGSPLQRDGRVHGRFRPIRLGAALLLFLALSMLPQPARGDGYRCTYDSLDRITRVEYHNGLIIDYIYDANGNLTNEVVTGGVRVGDVDSSGTVDVGDALAVLQCSVSDCVPDRTWCPVCPSFGGAVCTADVDGNAAVGVFDALSILQCSVADCTPPKPWCSSCSGGRLAEPGAETRAPSEGSCVRLTVDDVAGVPGGAVEIPIRIDVPAGIDVGALQFRLEFDSTQLEILPADTGQLDAIVTTNLGAPDPCDTTLFSGWAKGVGPTPWTSPGYLQIALVSSGTVTNLSGVCLLKIRGTGSDIVRIRGGAVAGSPASALHLSDVRVYDAEAIALPTCGPDDGLLSVVGCSTLTVGPATASSIPLSWTPALGGGATSYRIERAVGTGNCSGATLLRIHTDLGDLAWIDAGLSPNTRYCYRIVPQGGSCLQASPCVCATTCSSALALSASSTTPSSVTLSWTRVPGASGYELFRASGRTCAGAVSLGVLSGEATTTKVDSGLAEKTTYSYFVKPLDMGCDEATVCLTVKTPAVSCVQIESMDASGKPGDDVEILFRIRVPSALSLGGVQLRLAFDASHLEILPADPANLEPLVVTDLSAPDPCFSNVFATWNLSAGPVPYGGQPQLDIGLMSLAPVSNLADSCLLRVRGGGANRVRVGPTAPLGTSSLAVGPVLAFDADSAPLLACAPVSGTLTVFTISPPPVPDGRFVVRDQPFRLSEVESGSVLATWSTACAGLGYQVVEADGDLVGEEKIWSVTGLHCGANPGDTMPVLTPNASTGLVLFLVGSRDPSGSEGAYGFDSTGRIRPISSWDSALQACGITHQVTIGTCP